MYISQINPMMDFQTVNIEDVSSTFDLECWICCEIKSINDESPLHFGCKCKNMKCHLGCAARWYRSRRNEETKSYTCERCIGNVSDKASHAMLALYFFHMLHQKKHDSTIEFMDWFNSDKESRDVAYTIFSSWKDVKKEFRDAIIQADTPSYDLENVYGSPVCFRFFCLILFWLFLAVIIVGIIVKTSI